MDKEKFNLIIEKLLERTEEGKLEWKTTANRNTFLAVLKDSSVSVSYDFGEIEEILQAEGTYTFDFRNENGEIVESVTVSRHDAGGEYIEEFDKAETIYNLARRQSLKAEQTVDRILEQLAT